MASYTTPSANELQAWLEPYGTGRFETLFGIARGSVNSNFDVRAGGHRYFLRIYEAQTESGARADAELARRLAAAGVRTPSPMPRLDAAVVTTLASKPAVLLPWTEGNMRCQSSVTPAIASIIGGELSKVHLAGLDRFAPPSRFGVPALLERIEQLEAAPRFASIAPSLRNELLECEGQRHPGLPAGLCHGDLFRDNVLWKATEVVALLDFESASLDPYAYDLAVTLLAWCFGDSLEPELVSALVGGYERGRPLTLGERLGLYQETRFAALRFTITRLTDYAMRGSCGGARVMRDWRRFERRKQVLDAMGQAAFARLIST